MCNIFHLARKQPIFNGGNVLIDMTVCAAHLCLSEVSDLTPFEIIVAPSVLYETTKSVQRLVHIFALETDLIFVQSPS